MAELFDNTTNHLKDQGLTRNAIDFALGLIACNFKRSLTLQT